MIDWILLNAETIGDLSEAITAFAAVLALLIGYQQIKSIRATQREDHAMELFRQLVRLSFEHPQYATPNFAELRLDSAKFDQYEWFASFLNTTYEELIINGLHRRPDYRAMMIDGFKRHAGYYLSPEWTDNNYDAHFKPGFVKLKNLALDEWKKEARMPKVARGR